MQNLRSQLDNLQLQLGSLSADVSTGDTEREAATFIDTAHRSAALDATEQRRRAARLADGHAESVPIEMQEFFRRFGVSIPNSTAPLLMELSEPCGCVQYWVVPNAVSGQALERLQAAWRRESIPARASWEAEKAKGIGPKGMGFTSGTWVARTYFDLPRFAEADPSFRDLLDNPKVLPLIRAVMGGPVVLDQIQGRTVPSGPGINPDAAKSAAGYVGWHRDSPDHIATHLDFSISIKAFTFPFDVTPDGGVAVRYKPISPPTDYIRASTLYSTLLATLCCRR